MCLDEGGDTARAGRCSFGMWLAGVCVLGCLGGKLRYLGEQVEGRGSLGAKQARPV